MRASAAAEAEAVGQESQVVLPRALLVAPLEALEEILRSQRVQTAVLEEDTNPAALHRALRDNLGLAQVRLDPIVLEVGGRTVEGMEGAEEIDVALVVHLAVLAQETGKPALAAFDLEVPAVVGFDVLLVAGAERAPLPEDEIHSEQEYVSNM